MSIAEAVRRGDPDRFAAAMAAPPDARAPLIALYALNLELARAPWASDEPLVAEMRLQWWRDAIAELGQGKAPRGAEAIAAVAPFVSGDATAASVVDAMAEARRWDIWSEPFPDEAALWAHLDGTAGGLMWISARVLGAPPASEATVRDFAAGAGMAAWLAAVPLYVARGRAPLPDPSPAAIAGLATAGLARIAAARARRGMVPRAASPALFPGWQAQGLLTQAMRDPGRVLAGGLGLSEFRRRGTLLWRALAGRW